MKITLELPDSTILAFVVFARHSDDGYGLLMQSHGIQSDELFDGAEIVIEKISGRAEGDNG